MGVVMVWSIILAVVVILGVFVWWHGRGRGVAGRGVDPRAVNRSVENVRRKSDDQPQAGGPGLWGG